MFAIIRGTLHHHCWNTPPIPHCVHIHCLLSINVQHVSVNVSGCHLFSHGRVQWPSSALYTLPCQVLFCQTAPLQPSVAQQQSAMKNWWEGSSSTAILPTSTSDVGLMQLNQRHYFHSSPCIIFTHKKVFFLFAALLIYSNFTWEINFIGPFQSLFYCF